MSDSEQSRLVFMGSGKDCWIQFLDPDLRQHIFLEQNTFSSVGEKHVYWSYRYFWLKV